MEKAGGRFGNTASSETAVEEEALCDLRKMTCVMAV